MKFLALIFVIFCWSLGVSGQIFICVDENGRKHYSDKRCPSINKNKSKAPLRTAKINRYGKLEIPETIKAYSNALLIIKESIAFLIQREESNLEFSEIFNIVSEAERRHRVFLSNPDEKRFTTYAPFNSANHVRIIATLSDACRMKHYFSICAAIEGNPWLSNEEQTYRRQSSAHKNSKDTAHTSCDKATQAHTGGVISDKMMVYFCQIESSNGS